jgi:hypothetical protein
MAKAGAQGGVIWGLQSQAGSQANESLSGLSKTNPPQQKPLLVGVLLGLNLSSCDYGRRSRVGNTQSSKQRFKPGF